MSRENPEITFTIRNSPISPNYRILYKIALISIVLNKNCRGRKSSILKLQLFIWALKSRENQINFRSIINQTDISSIWSLDPTVLRALNFAEAEGLVEFEKSNVRLTTKGSNFAKLIFKNDALVEEDSFLSDVGLIVTEQLVKDLSKNWAK